METRVPTEELKKLYQQMADLSKKQCEKDCFKIRGHIGGCCDQMYCEIAINYAKEHNIIINPTQDTRLPCMSDSGCIVPPWLRPMCTLHICDKSLLDPKFYKEYMTLREQIDIIEYL